MLDVVGFRAKMGVFIPSTNTAAEGWLGKLVIAINTATLWHAYRASGLTDRAYGFGSLPSEH